MANDVDSYDVALSFAGEDRAFVEEVAIALESHGLRVFYDKFEEDRLLGRDLYEYLSELYLKRARVCLMFISRHYIDKPWPRHERRAAQARAFQADSEYILPIRLDDAEVPGILPTTGYLSSADHTTASIAAIVSKKLSSPVFSTRPLLKQDVEWRWGDWFSFGNEFVSQNQMWSDDYLRISARAGLQVPDFIGHGSVAEVTFEQAAGFCRILGGRLPSVEAIETIMQVKPHLLQGFSFERGRCSYEWSRSRVHGAPESVRAVQSVQDGGKRREYFGIVTADPGPEGARIAFRVAMITPPMNLRATP